VRKTFILLAILFQFAVLAFMVGGRELILRTGTAIRLRTAPVDPRDIFRGDYVRLNYEISRVPPHRIAAVGELKEIPKGTPLFVKLKEGADGLFEPDGVSLQKPRQGLFIRGRSRHRHSALLPGTPLWVDYGIEAYYVQQGEGRKIEKRRGGRSEVQVPLEMEIRVSPGGTAVLKGYRWSPLGIGLRILRSSPPDSRKADGPKSALLRLTLVNTSDAPLGIVDLPGACSFDLDPVPWAKKRYHTVDNRCESLRPADGDVIVLAPQQEKSIEIDLSDPRWRVTGGHEIKESGLLQWSERFRLVYRPPDRAACRHLEKRDIIWHGYLPSRVFHGRGRID